MRLFAILVILLVLFATLVVYSALVAASDCDDEDDLFDGFDDFDEIIAAAEQRGWNKGYDDCLKDLTYGTIRTRERSDNERLYQARRSNICRTTTAVLFGGVAD